MKPKESYIGWKELQKLTTNKPKNSILVLYNQGRANRALLVGEIRHFFKTVCLIPQLHPNFTRRCLILSFFDVEGASTMEHSRPDSKHGQFSGNCDKQAQPSNGGAEWQ